MNPKHHKASYNIIKKPYLNLQVSNIDLSISTDRQQYTQALSSQFIPVKINRKHSMQCNRKNQYVPSQVSPYSCVDEYDCNQFFDQFDNIFLVHQDASKLVKVGSNYANIEAVKPKSNLFSQPHHAIQFKQNKFNRNAKLKNKSSKMLYQKFIDKQNIPPTQTNSRQQKKQRQIEVRQALKGKIRKQRCLQQKNLNLKHENDSKTIKSKSQVMKTKSSAKSISISKKNSRKKASSSRSSLVYIDKMLGNSRSNAPSITKTVKAHEKNYHSFKWVDKCSVIAYNKQDAVKNVSINLHNPKQYLKIDKKQNKNSKKELPNYYCFNQQAIKKSRVQTQRKQGKELICNKKTDRSSNGANNYKEKILSMLSKQ